MHRTQACALVAPFLAKLPSGVAPKREMKCETLLEESSRNDTAALQDQFGFSSQKDRADFQHPRGCGKAKADTPRRPQLAHELGIGQRIRRTEIDWTFNMLA